MIIHIKSVPYWEQNPGEEFDKFLQDNKDKLVVVDFTASWCGPCRMIAPKFEVISNDVENKNVVFLKVDVDEVPDLTERYKVSAMPTFMFFKNGKMETSFAGASEDKLRNKIHELRV